MHATAGIPLLFTLVLLGCSRVLAPQDFPADVWVVERSGAREVAIVWNGAGPAPDARVFVESQPTPEPTGPAATTTSARGCGPRS